MTYDKLIADIHAFLEDDSQELADAMPTIVGLAEEAIYWMTMGRLPCYQQEVRVRLDNTSETNASFAYPNGMLEIHDILCEYPLPGNLGTHACDLLERREESYVIKDPIFNDTSPRPEYYFVRDYRIYPAQLRTSETYTFDVTGSGFETPLSPSNRLNWVSLNAENALFNQCLVEAAKLLRMDSKAYREDTVKALQPLMAVANEEYRSKSRRLFN